MPPADAPTLLRRYVDLHNEGVKSGDFAAVLSLFDEQAVMVFRGIEIGPFHGHDAISEAFRRHPPTDAIVPGELCGDPGCITGRYAWGRERGRPAGQIGVESRDGLIMRLTIRATTARKSSAT